MRKPVFPRILLLLALYIGIFTLLASMQFAKRGAFTQKTGSITVTGQYREPDSDDPLPPDEYLIEGETQVVFGGIEFGLLKGSEGRSFYLTEEDGTKRAVLPERMIISEKYVNFVFPGGTELSFIEQTSEDFQEMRINGVFSEDISGMELPFRPQRRTGIQYTSDGQFIAHSGGVSYTFGLSPVDASRRVIYIGTEGKPVSYRAIPESKTFSPDDFILPQAETATAYNEAIKRWRDQNYTHWINSISEQNNEDLVVALIAEALGRGTYRTAVSSVPQAFLGGSARTYESSVFLGNLSQAQRSLSAAERDRYSRISRQINENSPEFLLEKRVFEYFAVRGYDNLFDSAVNIVRGLDPAALTPDIMPGIFEGYSAFTTLRPRSENPFEAIANQAGKIISESLHLTDAGKKLALVFDETETDREYSLRLGKALLVYGEFTQNNSWVGIGRSLILSAISPDGSSATELTNARLYSLLSPVDSYPRALPIGTGNLSWVWTAAQSVRSTTQNNVLEIAVNFPAGETHYMIFMGIRPFTRLQLYNMDFRTDPQFERYDSSGWSYIAQEQILIVKMRHRDPVENIRIFFRE